MEWFDSTDMWLLVLAHVDGKPQALVRAASVCRASRKAFLRIMSASYAHVVLRGGDASDASDAAYMRLSFAHKDVVRKTKAQAKAQAKVQTETHSEGTNEGSISKYGRLKYGIRRVPKCPIDSSYDTFQMLLRRFSKLPLHLVKLFLQAELKCQSSRQPSRPHRSTKASLSIRMSINSCELFIQTTSSESSFGSKLPWYEDTIVCRVNSAPVCDVKSEGEGWFRFQTLRDCVAVDRLAEALQEEVTFCDTFMLMMVSAPCSYMWPFPGALEKLSDKDRRLVKEFRDSFSPTFFLFRRA